MINRLQNLKMVWNIVMPMDMATCSCINAPSWTLAPAFTLL